MGSRREIERWICEGRLRLNGIPVKLGDRLQPGDELRLNGRLVNWGKYAEQQTRVLVYHKPTGEVVTRKDTEGRPTIFSNLPKLHVGRWIAIGRLDINTQGLLLLTNNGELANRLMHPSYEIDREYAVRTLGNVDDAMLERLKQGVELDDGLAKFEDIQFNGGEGANKWYHVTVMEGRNRLVRHLWESQQIVVSRLIRVRYGPAIMPANLKARQSYEMNEKERNILLQYVGLNDDNQPVKSAQKTFKKRKK